MPDQLKAKLERFLVEAAECELIGHLSADADRRSAYRQKAEQLKRIAEEVKADMARPQVASDASFLVRQAEACRRLAAESSDALIRAELLTLAADFEKRAAEGRPAKA